MNTKAWAERFKIPRLGIAQIMFSIAWLGISFGLTHEVTNFQDQPSTISEIAVSPNGKILAVSRNRDTRVYKDSRRIAILPRTQVDGLKFIDDETLALVTGPFLDIQTGIHFFSIQSGSIERTFELTPRTDRAFVQADRFIVQDIRRIRNFKFLTFDIEAKNGDSPLRTSVSPHATTGISFSSDGRFAAFHWGNVDASQLKIFSDPRIRTYAVYDIHKEEQIVGLPAANSVRFDPYDRFVVVCGEDISCFEWPSKEERWSIPNYMYTNIQISPDGSKIAVKEIGADWIRIIETNSGKQLQKIKGSEKSGFAYAFSKDNEGIWVPSLDKNGGIQKVNIATGTVEQKVGASNSYYRWLIFCSLFVAWAIAYVKFVPTFSKVNWYASAHISTCALVLSILALNRFFVEVPRSLEFGSYFSFFSTMIQSYILLIVASIAQVYGLRCCPLVQSQTATNPNE